MTQTPNSSPPAFSSHPTVQPKPVDIFPVGYFIGALLLVLELGIVAVHFAFVGHLSPSLFGSTQTTPDGTMKLYISDIKQGDMQAAYDLYSIKARESESYGTFSSNAETAQTLILDCSPTVGSPSIQGNQAVVLVTFNASCIAQTGVFSSQDESEQFFLMQNNGNWFIDSGNN